MSIYPVFIDMSEVYVDSIDTFVTCVEKMVKIRHLPAHVAILKHPRAQL